MYGGNGNLLEEEMILDELVLVGLAHALQGVELALEVSFESVAGLDDLFHNLKSLFLGNAWTERVVCEIPSNSDSCRVDHCHLIIGEISVLQSISGHVRNVLVIWSVLVIILDDLVEKLIELGVCIVRTGIDSNA